MNSKWPDLIQEYISGTISDADAAALEQQLIADPALRDLYLDALNLDSALAVAAESAETALELPVPTSMQTLSTSRSAASGGLFWRSIATAAVGIVLGMLCTSVVFGYVMPRAVATASQLFTLVDGSFEARSGRLSSGFPTAIGVWSGDEAESVGGASVKAKAGAGALRFVRAAGDAAVQKSPANSCDVWQLVDLRGLKAADAEKGDATLELTAAFLDARNARGAARVQMSVRIYAFAGDPAALRAEWPMAIKEAQAFGAGSIDSWGGAPAQWRTAVAKMILPSDADFAVVQLVASKWTPHGQAAEFGDQYADDVRLTLKTQPKLPVRITQH